MSQKILIVGAGNPLRGDDGIGILIIQELQKLKASSQNPGPSSSSDPNPSLDPSLIPNPRQDPAPNQNQNQNCSQDGNRNQLSPLQPQSQVGQLYKEQLRAELRQLLQRSSIELLDIGTDGLALLDVVPHYSHVLIIDAVEMRAAPGTIKLFSPAEARINITHDALSTHGFGLAEMVRLAEELGITTTTSLQIIGIQPSTLAFGTELSPPLQQAFPRVLQLILQVCPPTNS
jgi:hydrogenase maturation protease